MPTTEYDMKFVRIDKDYEANIKQLQKEGWQIVPGMTPMSVWPCVRVHQEQTDPLSAAGIQLDLKVDDSKIMVIGSDGKIKS